MVDGKLTLNSMINDGMIDEYSKGCYRPSTKFNATMKVMSEIILKSMSKDKEGIQTKKFVKDSIEEPTLILDGILISTIVHYSKYHLDIESMHKDDVESRLIILREYYPDDKYIRDIKKMKFGG